MERADDGIISHSPGSVEGGREEVNLKILMILSLFFLSSTAPNLSAVPPLVKKDLNSNGSLFERVVKRSRA
jgi:hypothetical protein